MKVLITGHNGFKGTWLSLMLSLKGNEIYGISLPPIEGGIYQLRNVSELLHKEFILDISNYSDLASAINQIKPEVIFHLAAQPLVLDSYENPVNTIYTNVIGTMNLLEVARRCDSLEKLIVVTTDKVYKNFEKIEGYSEDDPLGGNDPYSVSKSMADQITQSWIKSFDLPITAIVRAGNVIGGGDRSKNRLLPDIITSLKNNSKLLIRKPNSVRPWQHVLDCLNGYLNVLDKMENFEKTEYIWNFGPDYEDFKTVRELCDKAIQLWPESTKIEIIFRSLEESDYSESNILTLNSARAKELLGWSNQMNFAKSVEFSVEWEYEVSKGRDPRQVSLNQINEFYSKVN